MIGGVTRHIITSHIWGSAALCKPALRNFSQGYKNFDIILSDMNFH